MQLHETALKDFYRRGRKTRFLKIRFKRFVIAIKNRFLIKEVLLKDKTSDGKRNICFFGPVSWLWLWLFTESLTLKFKSMEQAIFIQSFDLKEFKALAKKFNINYDIIEMKAYHGHKGVIKGEKKDLFEFAYYCGIKSLSIYFN
ncbi:MAG: hypothetical protein KAF41_00845 [Flavobacterium sp.]|nr:hypothetical protein [Flavobacterium sp.]